MTDLASSSRVVATDLRRAERSINMAARDTAQFLLTTLDVTETHKLSPPITHRTVKATISALAALVESQEQMALRAHVSIERAGTYLGLTETNWGEGYPKPGAAQEEDDKRQLA
ncbi:hypothetical protein [Sphingomonas sp. PAMC 26605]|uniref:hypothetical protein n=1 Tax=Sphingomonas sp. PAMC 26605 TaxID=1112214 RepID=UPI00026CD81F|nr:hypothetical protein [Sphingomonas sp. PAMC 26605]